MTINIIRGVAVLFVFIAHADAYGMVKIWPFYIQPIKIWMGQLGVAIFFILSGFLIWHSGSKNLKQDNLIIYAINRITRIVPLYLACIFSVWILSNLFIGSYRPNVTAENVLWHIMFTQDFVNASRTINPVLWSLSHEVVFYVLVPILMLSRFFTPMIFALSIPITQYIWHLNNNITVFVQFWALFAIGILIAHYQNTLKTSFSILLLLFGFVLSISVKSHIGTFLVASSVVFLLIQVKDAQLNFTLKPIAWLGLISYSVYIWHYLIIELVAPYIIKNKILEGHHLVRGLSFCTFVLLISYLSYRFIELPFMQHIRKSLIASLKKTK